MKYNEASIKVYKGLEGVIANPSMYIGRLGEPAIFHMLRECVENSTDESMANHNNYICVKLENNKYIVIDNGRGIPVGKHKTTGISTLTSIMTTLHSGGKFDSKSYEHSRGTHGVGVSVVNALSDILEIYTFRDNQWYYQKYKQGKVNSKLEKVKIPKELREIGAKRGTVVIFSPSKVVEPPKKLESKKVMSWLQDIANLNKGLKIRFIDNKNDIVFINKGGPDEYLKSIIEKCKCSTLGKPFILDTNSLTIAIQWSDFEDQGLVSYVSGALTADGGTHVKGLHDAISKALKPYAGKKQKFTANDLRFGLVGFINYKLSRASFDSQTKSELVTKQAKEDVIKIIGSSLDKFFKENKKLAIDIVSRATIINSNREKLKESTRAATKVQNNVKSLLPGKLACCKRTTPPEERELFLCEGDSGGENVKKARNILFQEVLPLKGKPLNGAKDKTGKILKSEEVLNILTAIGFTKQNLTDLAKKKKVDVKFRVGKIMITADADVDGYHIEQLICTDLFLVCPEIFKRGMVYCVKTPLFQASYKDKKWFADTLEELKELCHPKSIISRLKGLGELNADQLARFINPKTRNIIKIKNIVGEDIKEFMDIVGEKSETRKKLLGV